MAHQTHNTGGSHCIKSPLRVSVVTNQCVKCGTTFSDRSTAQNHVVSSWNKGTCRTDRSHMTWSLEEVTQPFSGNLCAQEFGDSRTGHACNTQEKDTNASHLSTKRDGAGAEEQRNRRQLRRTASPTKQDGGASGSTMAVAGKAKADCNVEQCARNDFSSISGNDIYRHHVEPRDKLFVLKEETFPISLWYIDEVRTTHTPLDVLRTLMRFETYWNFGRVSRISQRSMKNLLTDICGPGGSRQFKQPQGLIIFDQICGPVCQKQLNERKSNNGLEKPKLDNARKLRGIYFLLIWTKRTSRKPSQTQGKSSHF